MKTYDVIVVGAGPAGGQCARECQKAGKSVLLVEKAKDFSVNNFSTAGSLMEVMEDFSLPQEVCGSFWNQIYIRSTKDEVLWSDEKPKGVVFDFKKLREFLAKEVERYGGEVLLGWSYTSHKDIEGKTVVEFRQHGDKVVKAYACKVLVDATGAERKVINPSYDKRGAVAATGIEYLVEVPEEVYKKWQSKLSFFLGTEWMPQGYGWIFPMEKPLLKVGVGRYFVHDHYVPYEDSYRHYLELLMEKCLGSKEYPIKERHGKTLYYTFKRKDPHYKGNVVAIGDAVSTVNPLALEGIRHAMHSASMAAKQVICFLEGKSSPFAVYEKEVGAYCGLRWSISEFLMKKIYCQPRDTLMDQVVKAFQTLSYEEMINLSFHYKTKEALKYIYQLTKKRLLKGGL